jgi:peptidoglycan/xylan/chitin deacetylase (PgdA/CDA1 family)
MLRSKGIKATFFVITHLKEFEGKQLLTIKPELLKEMRLMGHEIGSHTCTHMPLTNLSRDKLVLELKDSKEYLSKLLGEEVMGFSYPGGFYNVHIVLEVFKYYRYARLGGKRFESRSWNANRRGRYSRYLIEGIGAKELLKLPLKHIMYRGIKPVIIFHDDPPWLIEIVVKYLKSFGARFVTLGELVEAL